MNSSSKSMVSKLIPGGLAEKAGLTPAHFDRVQLRRGEKVEHEHTPNRAVAREIAMDHLTEDPRYYERLEKMEKKATFLAGTQTALEKTAQRSLASYAQPIRVMRRRWLELARRRLAARG